MLRLDYLDQFGALLEKSLSSDETYDAVLGILEQVIDYNSATLFINDPVTNRLEVSQSHGEGIVDLIVEVTFERGEGLSGWVASQHAPVIFSTIHTENRDSRFHSLVSMPLWSEDRLLGVLNLGHSRSGFYRQEHKPEFQKLASQLSMIVEQLRLRDELRAKNNRLEELLAELRTTQQALVEKERLAAIGEVVVKIKHEINNPLSVIIGFVDLLSMECSETLPEFAANLAKIKTAAKQIESITKALENVESSQAEEYHAGVKMLKID